MKVIVNDRLILYPTALVRGYDPDNKGEERSVFIKIECLKHDYNIACEDVNAAETLWAQFMIQDQSIDLRKYRHLAKFLQL